MHIFIGADHRGFALKSGVLEWLEKVNQSVIDCGNVSFDAHDDYPDFAFAVAEKVSAELQSRGILLCGSGAGVCIAANKVKNIRCVLGISSEAVEKARQEDDVNILALAADFILDEDAKIMIEKFLQTPFNATPAHVQRLEKIAAYEGIQYKI